MKKLNRALKQTLVAVAVTLASARTFAEGFRNSPAGAFGLGRAGGRIAQVDDASAISQNPANLADLKASEVQFTPSVIYMDVKFDSAFGFSARTEKPWKYLPNLFIAKPILDGQAVLGLGITVPYGLSVNWDENSPAFATPALTSLRYNAPHYTELETININPTVAFHLGEHVTLGLGLDIMWSQLTLKQFYPWLLVGGGPDGNLKAKGDGVGVGGNLGLTWKVTDRQRVAVTWKLPMDVNYEGSATVDNINPTGTFLGVTPSSSFETKIKYPMQVALGYGIQVTDKFRIEADGEWIQFSRFKSLDLSLANNAILLTALGQSTSIAQNWKDTFTVGIGGDYQINPNWTVRAGYQFYQSPVPDSTFSPTIPDADQNVITVGLRYQHGKHSIEGAYGLDFYDKRTITTAANPTFNGTYDVTVHLFSFAYRYAF
ncbi:MAG: hypothetical protein RLZZ350_666 [Verrucomicrobiota bacterium]